MILGIAVVRREDRAALRPRNVVVALRTARRQQHSVRIRIGQVSRINVALESSDQFDVELTLNPAPVWPKTVARVKLIEQTVARRGWTSCRSRPRRSRGAGCKLFMSLSNGDRLLSSMNLMTPCVHSRDLYRRLRSRSQ